MTSKKHPTEWKPPTSFRQLLRYMRKAFPESYKSVSVEITDSAHELLHEVKVTTYMSDSGYLSASSFAGAWTARLEREFSVKSGSSPNVDVTDADLKKATDEHV